MEKCDYCHQVIPEGEDIFLEGWINSLACADCCEKYSLLDKWEKAELISLAGKLGLHSPKVLAVSQELDHLIAKYQKGVLKMNKAFSSIPTERKYLRFLNCGCNLSLRSMDLQILKYFYRSTHGILHKKFIWKQKQRQRPIATVSNRPGSPGKRAPGTESNVSRDASIYSSIEKGLSQKVSFR